MTIEITLRPDHLFDGETVSETIKKIAKFYIEQDDYNQEIISIKEHFDNGFCRAFYQSEIEKVQSDLEAKLIEAEQEYCNQLGEEDWREQESVSYWENR